MSISSQITRINNAKAAIKTAIAAKGVTVPEGALIDDYAALIGNISGGGETSVVASGNCGDYVNWELYNTGELIISGAGAMYGYNAMDNYSPFYENNNIKSVVIEYGITTIGNFLFYACNSITSVIVPDSIKTIGVSTFNSCDRLVNITIGKGVTTLEERAFYNCENLLSITIPKAVTLIDNNAFKNCDNLTSVYYEGTKAEWDSITIATGNDNLINATLCCAHEEVNIKEEQEQTIDIERNGTMTVLPDEGKTLSKVTVNVNVPTEGGGGSGIIDVTELPTSGIDENAVYRLTETYKASGTGVYIKAGEEIVTLSELLEMKLDYLPTIHMYEVDNTNTMSESSLAGDPATDFLYIYIVKSSGIAYVKLYGSKMSASEAIFGVGFPDKGATEDIYAETEDGIYTTLTRYKSFVKYFIRENSRWKEITAQVSRVSLNGITDIVVLSGSYDASETIEVTHSGTTVDIKDLVVKNKKIPSVLVNTPVVSEIVERLYTEIEEEWFLKKNGEYVETIREYVFAYCPYLETAVIPEFIVSVNARAFAHNSDLTTVTFKGKPKYIDQYTFQESHNLSTINVPWAEGEVDNAPWGALFCEIKYNYSEFEVGTPDEPVVPFEPLEPV